MKVLIIQHRLWQLIGHRNHHRASIDKTFRDLRKFEAQGLYYPGVTADLVRVFNDETTLVIKVPPSPNLHWWDKYIVPVPIVQMMLDKDNYIGTIGEYLVLCWRALDIYDRAIKSLIADRV